MLTTACFLQVYAIFEPKRQPHKRATHGDMLQALDDAAQGADLVILDARGQDQYSGQVSVAPRVMHVLLLRPRSASFTRRSYPPLQGQRYGLGYVCF